MNWNEPDIRNYAEPCVPPNRINRDHRHCPPATPSPMEDRRGVTDQCSKAKYPTLAAPTRSEVVCAAADFERRLGQSYRPASSSFGGHGADDHFDQPPKAPPRHDRPRFLLVEVPRKSKHCCRKGRADLRGEAGDEGHCG